MSMQINLEDQYTAPEGDTITIGEVYVNRKQCCDLDECDGSFVLNRTVNPISFKWHYTLSWFKELKEPHKSKAEERILKLFSDIKRNNGGE